MKHLQKCFAVLALLALVLAGSTANASNGVNWEKGEIIATGMGVAPANTMNIAQAKLLAKRAAVVDAYRQLAEIINGVSITSETTVQGAMVVSDVTRTKVSATIKGAKIIKENITPAGAYEVTMSVPMFGASRSLASAVMEAPKVKETFPKPVASVPPTPVTSLPTTISATVTVNIPATPITPSETSPEKSKSPENSSTTEKSGAPDNSSVHETPSIPQTSQIPSIPVQPSSGPTFVPPVSSTPGESSAAHAPKGKAVGKYTGLIVDCRGLGLEAAMSPVIKNDSGSPIYGYKNLDIDKVVANGMASYSKDINNCQRAGSHPLIVRAVGLDGNNINPVLSTADANRVLIENGATGFLDKTNVVFLR